MKRVERVEQMSEILAKVQKCLDTFELALDEYKNSQKLIKKLSKYYSSKIWLSDYEADESGKIPREIGEGESFRAINRGALSEDGIYNAIWLNKRLARDMKKLSNLICKE
ncbi:DUF4298 domain-containing protein [Campylobacter sp. JMF_06 NA1]|uniref:DUF4298 domain-containing protein n=1 Tax=Campylobacter sp. JMF_06 NA1 TaxID=2983823 RepID=UPI0022E9B572|nr:DUF4298 domain-containing protein [Campylobacter sp. JMF_06 NA1]MDA3077665.1 DUF4298 domain-containing protein [Campylobacter sp. JMF_06 NA1]